MNYFISKTVVNFTFDDGTSKAVFSDCPRYKLAIEAIKAKAPEDEIRAILDGNQYVKRWAAGRFEIVDNKVTWLAHPEYEVPKSLCDRLLEYAASGYPVDSFVKFMERLLLNPSKRSVETFYGFIEQQGLTIDEDGFVMGYKGVTEDLKDCHTRSFDNSPGTYHEMPRNHVDDDPERVCSTGFHFGGHEYASTFGPRMVLVRVDPADLVCVPHDCSQGKVRVCRYWVVKEVPNETKMRSFFASEPDESEDGEADRFPNGRVECPACGTYCDAEDEYCRGCGEQLPKTEDDEDGETGRLFCPACGAMADPDNAFCPSCGTKLK